MRRSEVSDCDFAERGLRSARLGFSSRQYLLSAAVVTVVLAAGFGGYLYYKSNSPGQLGIKAQIAMEQGDTTRAIEFLKRALAGNPGGQTGVNLRILMAKALVAADREADARPYLAEALAIKPEDPAVLDMLTEAHVHRGLRSYGEAMKPLSDASIAEVVAVTGEEAGELEKLPRTPRNLIGEAQLRRLAYEVVENQLKQAKARLALAEDPVAADSARTAIAAIKDPAPQREKTVELLNAALAQDAKNSRAAELLVRYAVSDRNYDGALKLYEGFKGAGVSSPDMAMAAEDAIRSDAARQPDENQRLSAARAELEAYAKAHEKDAATARIYVAIGKTFIDQDRIADAAGMAAKAKELSPGDVGAQILLIQCRIGEKKPADALALAAPLASSNGRNPEVWFYMGLANSDLGDLKQAEDDYHKALALNPGWIPARRSLMENDRRLGNSQDAALLASQLNQDDRYDMRAWAVTVEDEQKHGQGDRARGQLTALAADPGLPAESRGALIGLLLDNHLPDPAKKLLAQLPPGDENAMGLAAAVAAGSGDLAQARALLAKDVAGHPENDALRIRYAELLMRSDMGPDAQGQLDSVMAGKTVEAGELVKVAGDYLKLRLPEPALAAAKRALAEQPKNTQAQAIQEEATAMLAGKGTGEPAAGGGAGAGQASAADALRLAAVALAKKDYAGALTEARAGLAKDFNSAPLHQTAARALAALGQVDQAVDEIVAAAHVQPDSPASFETFVALFRDAAGARKGLGYGNALEGVNRSLGNWAMGRLAEMTGDAGSARGYFNAGIEAAGSTQDPAAAKGVLYASVLELEGQQRDAAALKKDAETFAADPAFTVQMRLMAADQLRMAGDGAGAGEQLDRLTAVLAPTAPTELIGAMVNQWLAIHRTDRATALLEKELAIPGKEHDGELLNAYATLLSRSDPDKALAVRQKIAGLDPSSPQARIQLAQGYAAAGDEAAAFRTLNEVKGLGETGQRLAAEGRMRLLISMGLLHEAGAELAANGTGGVGAGGAPDSASLLAMGRGWAELGKADEARQALAAIPSYAAEYPPAVAELAGLDAKAGNFDAAIKALARAPGLEGELFNMYLLAGRAEEALALAKKEMGLFPVNSAAWQRWTVAAATGARETGDYGQAIALLNTQDPAGKKAAAFDIAMLDILANKLADARAAAGDIPDAAPTYNRSTILLLAGADEVSTKPAVLLESGPASAVYAYFALHFPKKIGEIPEIAHNGRLIPQDFTGLLTELAASPENMAGRLGQLALAQRLIESGWTTRALRVLDEADKSPPATTLALLLRHRANMELHRTAEASAVAGKLEGVKNPAPSVRILEAAVAADKGDYAGAVAALQPLEALKRPDVLTTLATFQEKLGHLDAAIALHREVRAIDPGDVLAANNLAYTLAEAHPADKAALAEARAAIAFAIGKAPQVPTFQDTLGWIEILSGDAGAGAKRVARALPGLRLSAGVHYHLGMAYARLGETELARLHLENVGFLAEGKAGVPEAALAGEAGGEGMKGLGGK